MEQGVSRQDRQVPSRIQFLKLVTVTLLGAPAPLEADRGLRSTEGSNGAGVSSPPVPYK